MTAKTTNHAGPADNHHGKCPHCGACQCCGRGAGFTPYPYYAPWTNPYFPYTFISTTSNIAATPLYNVTLTG